MKNKIYIIGPNGKKKGGVATHVQNLINYEPFRNAVIYDPGSRKTTLKGEKSGFITILNSFFQLRKLLKKEKSVLLINASIYPSSFSKLLLILLFIPKREVKKIFVFFHGGRFNKKFRIFSYFSFLFNPFLKKVNVFFFLAKIQQAGFLEKIGNYHTSLFNNYSNSNEIVSRKPSGKDNPVKLLFVGRIVREKGLFELVNAIAKLRDNKVLPLELRIIGDGKDFSLIKNLVREKKLESIIEFNGFLKGINLKRKYHNSDFLVLPSYNEGFPYVFIEAMQAGIPVIATNSGALNRLIKPGYNGYFIESRNVEDLYQKLKFIIEQKPDLQRNCREYFIENLCKQKGEEFYLELLEERNLLGYKQNNIK